uniref:Uncharacterized protein n=1 Tax=Knipowitschia caucasica TaxID=637954 RepID=A0AAV2KZW5_KNICA
MQVSYRKRLQASAGRLQDQDLRQPRPQFHLDLWAVFLLQAWFLDLGRAVVMFLERSPRSFPDFLLHLGITAVAMGTTAHLVTDAVTLRLVAAGYNLHLSIRENKLMKDLTAPEMVDAFELLGYYGDTVGHVTWSLSFFLVLFLYFGGCFCHKKQQQESSRWSWILVLPTALYIWFVVTERQTFVLFLFTCFAMVATVMRQRGRGLVTDSNGSFMILRSSFFTCSFTFSSMTQMEVSTALDLVLHSFFLALLLVVLWSTCWWRDSVLRRKHKGLLFVPQPRTICSLHLHQRQ